MSYVIGDLTIEELDSFVNFIVKSYEEYNWGDKEEIEGADENKET
jgi:hypothetical protein